MGKVYTGIKRACIYDPVTGDKVQINQIAIDGTAIEVENISVDTTSSQVYGGVSYKAMLTFFDSAIVDQIEAWQLAGTPLNMVASGEHTIQWYQNETVKLTRKINPDKRTGLNMYMVEMEHQGDDPDIHVNASLLAYLGWQDTNTNNLADGYTLSSATAASFSSEQQQLSATGPDGGMYADIVFPIEGIEVTASIAVVTAPGGGGDVAIDQRNFAGTTIDLSQTANTGTGVKSHSATTATGVHTLRIYPYRINTSGQSGTISYPAATTNGFVTTPNEFISW